MIIEQLVRLYEETSYYPSNPELYNWEVSIDTSTTPMGADGLSLVWKGLLLGRIRVAMKTPNPNIPGDVATRVSSASCADER